ncbi:MAG: hypothetical protein PWQ77_395 [Kosmotogales bacterium]|nr:hypothetical protein [Kosmotogales bacterium]
MGRKLIILFLIVFLSSLAFAISIDFDKMKKFIRVSNEPILMPEGIGFECKAVFNPTIIEENGKFYLFYRAENWEGENKWNGTSSIGLAVSSDGINFEKRPNPVIFPTEDYEIPGGCEDPRIVKIEDKFVLTYTGYDGKVARLCLAISDDLINWEKLGPVFKGESWTKSGAVVPEKINGKYYMYYGDTNIYLATSENLTDWKISLTPVLEKRIINFDSALVEPGPTPLITDEGILLIYNSADYSKIYRAGAALFDIRNPGKLVKRTEDFLIEPEFSWEKYGQVPNVVFIEGAAIINNRLYVYYGAADTYIGAAYIELN